MLQQVNATVKQKSVICVVSGRFNGKMMVMQALADIDALPWQADWYCSKVREAGLTRNFRLYYAEHSDHIGVVNGVCSTHLVNYEGALQQILRDLAAWVERGVEPPAATNYRVVDSQIVVPRDAAQRLGIQPVVDLKANGTVRTEIGSGESVTFTAEIEVIPGMGKIVAAVGLRRAGNPSAGYRRRTTRRKQGAVADHPQFHETRNLLPDVAGRVPTGWRFQHTVRARAESRSPPVVVKE